MSLNGCRVRYQLEKREGKPRVLFLHGWGCDLTIFSFIMSGFAPDATVAALDFPGHGESADPPAPWSVSDYAEATRQFIVANDLAPVSLVAHSFGGRVAIKLAAEHPELIDKLVITGGAGLRRTPTESARKRSQTYKRYSNLLTALGKARPLAPLAERLQTKLRNRFGSPDYVKLNEVMRGSFVKIVNEDLAAQLPQIQAPTLLIWGTDDTETPLWMGQMMEQEIPDAGLVLFEGGSHFAFLEQWQRFLLIARQFILEDQNG